MRTTTFDHRASRRRAVAHGLLAVAVLAAVAAWVLAPHRAWSDEHEGDGSGSPRYELTRSADFLFRVDTETGQVWAVPVSGDGGWRAMGAPPGADEPGLYKIAVLPGARPGPGGPAPRPRLLRTDQASGRAWLAPAAPDGQWSLIAESAATDG